ncbi:MAG: hypothetical protein F6K42_22225 [Leptolyngbya sp. SIO1D8]|nr:hypothetical protein [Leptolyngbya sp. SIO1D8]
MKKTLSALITAILCVSGLAALQLPRLRSHLANTELNAQTIQAEEALQQERLQLWKTMPVFGFDNLVADWAFLNFLQYFGHAEARELTGYTVSPDLFSTMIQRDPYFRQVYQFLSSSVTLFAGQPAETVALVEKGLSHMTPTFPEDSFWLWRYKAVDELLFLGEVEAAIASLDKSAEWADQSPMEDANLYVASAQRLATFLRENPNSRQGRVNAWFLVWNNGINQQVRQYAQSQIEALGYRMIEDENGIRLEDINPDTDNAVEGEP